MATILKRPSAWVPLALTAVMLIVMGAYLLHVLPPDPVGDEGTGAHLFQIWIVLEFFSMLFFGLRELSHPSRNTMKILALQILFAFIPFAIVYSQRW